MTQVTAADKQTTANILGYQDWGDATDYRLSGNADAEVARVVGIVARHREQAVAERDARIAELEAKLARVNDAARPLIRAVKYTKALDRLEPLPEGRRTCKDAVLTSELETLVAALQEINDG